MLGVAAVLLLAPALLAEPDAAGPCERPCPDSGRPQLIVIVRQPLQRPLPPPMLARIAGEVKNIWRPWVDIELVSPDEAVGVPVDDTLDLVLTDREASRSGDGLGWIEFVDDEPSRKITVSVTIANRLADGGSWQGRPIAAWPSSVRETVRVRALGRGIAHEVGHYLLRSKTHTPRGLMREAFSVAEIMARATPRSLLGSADMSRLQRRTASYLLARRAKGGVEPQS